MSVTEIKVPNIGDFRDVEVIEVLVSEGQALKKKWSANNNREW